MVSAARQTSSALIPCCPIPILPTMDLTSLMAVDCDSVPESTQYLQLERPEECVAILGGFLGEPGLVRHGARGIDSEGAGPTWARNCTASVPLTARAENPPPREACWRCGSCVCGARRPVAGMCAKEARRQVRRSSNSLGTASETGPGNRGWSVSGLGRIWCRRGRRPAGRTPCPECGGAGPTCAGCSSSPAAGRSSPTRS